MKRYTVKTVIRLHKQNKIGHKAIYIRITIDRKTSFLATGYFVHPKYWDDKKEIVRDSHPTASIINADITDKKTKLIRSIVDKQIKGQATTSAEVKTSTVGAKKLTNIFDFLDQFVKDVKHKRKASTLENYRKHTLRLEQFHGSRTLAFEEITPDYLQRYENHLREDVEGNYIHALFKTLKTIFNAAKRKGVITCYPFANYENPVYKAPVKDYLSFAELARWEKFADEVKDRVQKETAVYFLLGCYSGLRISDWLTFNIETHVMGDTIKLHAKKNGELVLMPISKPLARNLERIALLPLTIAEPTINEKLKIIAAKCGIKKHVTTHTGRHTFAVTMCAEQGISSETCAELMAITIQTCVENYYRVSALKINNETREAWKGLE